MILGNDKLILCDLNWSVLPTETACIDYVSEDRVHATD